MEEHELAHTYAAEVMRAGTKCAFPEAHVLSLLEGAAKGGNLRVLRWLMQQGHAVTPFALEVAAYYGHPHLVQHLAAQGHAYDVDALYAATLVGGAIAPAQMEWLRARGAGDWSPAGLSDALLKRLASGHPDATPALAEWLLARGAQCPESVRELTRRGAPAAHVAWALRHGCGWGGAAWTAEHCDEAERARAGLRYALHRLGCPCACQHRDAGKLRTVS
eukprot:TRINITY_DN15607_c0_g1_i1.p3 TRINITY_DN15607_c0_g1~~TRINITY_DN15607_c0_g1_i1.p3  ORF type:complete len:220 (-),score=48.23 TRINITY_DN15607_c0_g1_i1:219-878(-)